jgi:hypothetical protein
MSYLNFAVEVTALPNGKYHISVQSPVGEASVDADSPFTPQEIENYLQILGRERRVSNEEALRTAREFGQRLFIFLIRSSNEISNAYFGSQREARSSDGLRIRLTVDKAGVLSQLPWEYLRDPTNDFLALSPQTPLVRYTQQLITRPPAVITMPLRVLVMISAPEDYPALDVEGEWQRLQEATASLQAQNLIQLERLDTATLIALQRRLRESEYHIFHYIGHSDYDPATQAGVLVFENERDNSKGQVISGADLSRNLAIEETLRLVVLNSCHSARRPDADVLSGIASSIVARQIPAVVAMQFVISDGAAKAFAEEFYRALAALLPLDAAVSEGRLAVSNRIQNNEWATPVLYLRLDDGVLFRSTQAGVATTPSQPPVSIPVAPQPRRPSLGWLLLFGGIALAAILLLLLFISRFIFPPLPTATPPAALLPDLQIGNLRTSPRNPAPGQIMFLSITITNGGEGDSGAFTWGWDASVNPPILSNSLGGTIDNIPPGASKNISFPFSYGWWGTYSSQLRVDSETQIVESDESNNFKFFQVEMALLPFDVDFSRLPTNQLVEPPMILTGDEFNIWNVDFAVNAAANPDCADTAFALLDVDGDVVLNAAGTNAACATLPLSITVLRGPVGGAIVEILPNAVGTATLTYYADADGEQLISETTQEVQIGEVAQLVGNDPEVRGIRRIEISLPGQVVQLTRLVMTPRQNT